MRHCSGFGNQHDMVPPSILDLVQRFDRSREFYTASGYKKVQGRKWR
jgi:hypothetical protein